MSSSLVRKGLELVDSEFTSSSQLRKKLRNNNSRKDLISKKKKSYRDHGSRVLGDVKSEAAQQVELARRISSNDKDRTTDNLKNLIALSNTSVSDLKRAHKIFDRTVKRRKIIDDPVPENNSSLFSEEDFQKFEEEYFVG